MCGASRVLVFPGTLSFVFPVSVSNRKCGDDVCLFSTFFGFSHLPSDFIWCKFRQPAKFFFCFFFACHIFFFQFGTSIYKRNLPFLSFITVTLNPINALSMLSDHRWTIFAGVSVFLSIFGSSFHSLSSAMGIILNFIIYFGIAGEWK